MHSATSRRADTSKEPDLVCLLPPTALTAATIIIFWPAAFFIQGDRQTAAEVARLKGEMEALESASIKKNCGIQFRQG
jgi:hypothetical protein